MSTAQQLVTRKGGSIASLPGDATVLHAAQLMNERHIGSVLVIDDGRLAGIFTERDVMRRVVAAHRNPETVRLVEVMTDHVACAAPHTTLDEVRTVMREKRIRHLPVLADDGITILGMISIGDLNEASREVQDQTIQYLEQYISVA